MANLDASKTTRGPAVLTANRITMSGGDTFTFVPNSGQVLELHNNTAGSLNVVVKGSAPSNAFVVAGTGTTFDLSAGLPVTVPAGASKLVHLDAVAAYLAGNGTVTITGATGITALILTN